MPNTESDHGWNWDAPRKAWYYFSTEEMAFIYDNGTRIPVGQEL